MFSPATVLDLWTRVTPQTVFPGRAVGRLADGFEASLLALACDPTEDWTCTQRIAHREKQGVALGETAAAVRRVRQPRRNPDAPAVGYVGGRWYEADGDGVRFVRRDTVWAEDGMFVAGRPARVDTVVDLGGAYVVPPYGEAHNHSVDGPWTAETVARYLREGVFYYKNPNVVGSWADLRRGLYNRPDALDAVFANGGLSVDEGHPERLYRGIAANNEFLDADSLDGAAFFDTPTVEALERRWPEVLAGRPDFVKLFLLDAADENANGVQSGLAPDVFRRAVELAHESGLRAVAHVETASDLALAVEAGADEAAHLPGYWLLEGIEPEANQISDTLAAEMGRRGFVVATTTLVTEQRDASTPEAAAGKAAVQAVQVENLRRLHAAGVSLAVGTDVHTHTALDEVRHLRSLGAFSDADLLRLWVETGPVSVFPDRAIGQLRPGYEASFLALACDPAADFVCVERIRQRVKQGEDLDAEDLP